MNQGVWFTRGGSSISFPLERSSSLSSESSSASSLPSRHWAQKSSRSPWDHQDWYCSCSQDRGSWPSCHPSHIPFLSGIRGTLRLSLNLQGIDPRLIPSHGHWIILLSLLALDTTWLKIRKEVDPSELVQSEPLLQKEAGSKVQLGEWLIMKGMAHWFRLI